MRTGLARRLDGADRLEEWAVPFVRQQGISGIGSARACPELRSQSATRRVRFSRIRPDAPGLSSAAEASENDPQWDRTERCRTRLEPASEEERKAFEPYRRTMAIILNLN